MCCECECVSCSCDVARSSKERNCLGAFREGRCDNNDATSDSITCSYVLICVVVTGGTFGGAVVGSNVVRVGAVTFVSTVTICVCVCVCVCVFSSLSFWTSMDVPAGVTQEEGNTGFSIHLLSAVLALIFLARRIQPFLSLVDREVEFCVLTI